VIYIDSGFQRIPLWWQKKPIGRQNAKKRQKHEFLPHLKESQRYIQDYSSQLNQQIRMETKVKWSKVQSDLFPA
jgi:hypothetical protein